jgi:transcription elongation factor Elf1
MKCPLCKSREHVEIDLHADGFSQDARECGDCGGIWTFSGDVMKLIRGAVEKREKVCNDFVCPTCKGMVSHETDLDAFQFHEELYECAICGTVCSVAHDQMEVVMDSQRGSFLESTGDLVEADDYNMM